MSAANLGREDRGANGAVERPICGRRLYWNRP